MLREGSESRPRECILPRWKVHPDGVELENGSCIEHLGKKFLCHEELGQSCCQLSLQEVLATH